MKLILARQELTQSDTPEVRRTLDRHNRRIGQLGTDHNMRDGERGRPQLRGMRAIIRRIKDNGTSPSISYGTKYPATCVTLPMATVLKTVYLTCIWNDSGSKLGVIGADHEAELPLKCGAGRDIAAVDVRPGS